jgi:thiamine transport system ATP-binding protein
MTNPRLDVRSLTVRLDAGGPPTLDGISFDVGVGEIVAVLGPSGGGKSTLLRAVAGLEHVDGGSVHLDGVDITGLAAHHRNIALMFQEYALFPHLDVASNIAYGLRMRAVPRSERRQRVRELLDLVRLAGFGDRAVSSLSGGERQRVALARAIATEPSVLMLDEPLSALDRSLRRSILTELETLFRQTGLSVVHVTHDQDEAFAIADRVVILRNGRIERSGTASELWSEPGSESVARFLGHRCVAPVSVIREFIVAGTSSIELPENASVLVLESAVEVVPVDVGGVGDAVVESSRFVGGRFELDCRLLASGVEIFVTVSHELASRFLPGTVVSVRIDPRGVRALEP